MFLSENLCDGDVPDVSTQSGAVFICTAVELTLMCQPPGGSKFRKNDCLTALMFTVTPAAPVSLVAGAVEMPVVGVADAGAMGVIVVTAALAMPLATRIVVVVEALGVLGELIAVETV